MKQIKNIGVKIIALVALILGLINIFSSKDETDIIIILWTAVIVNSFSEVKDNKSKSYFVLGIIAVIMFILYFIKKINYLI